MRPRAHVRPIRPVTTVVGDSGPPTPMPSRRGPVLVRGIGEVGSAVAYWLFTAGCAVALHDEAPERVLRRGHSFADAATEGFTRLEGIGAHRLLDPAETAERLFRAPTIPVLCTDAGAALAAAPWRAVVDARPHDPGLPDGSVVLTSPMGGLFRTLLSIGTRVPRGKFIGMVGNALLWAPQDGVLAGLVRDGTRVERDTPLIEIGPPHARPFGIAPAPRRMAEDVLQSLPSVVGT
ncbi:MAG TPA: hypothetical protein VD860_02270 [Azospirillum sp.]|nr:hypothetical protein [Azospirillum sp.]